MLQPIHTFIHRVGRLVLLDRAADPAANGEVQRNATHIKVYSGGAVRNLSDVGTSPSHTHASHTGIGTGDHHAQLHATAHASGGGDAVKLDDLAAPTDITTLNASLTAHGLLIKLGGGATNFLRADGTWAAPAGGGGTDISVRAFNSAAQSIPNAAWTTVTLNSETYDTNTMHDLVTNNSRLTCNTAGKFMVVVAGQFATNSAGRRLCRILKNGAGSPPAAEFFPSSVASAGCAVILMDIMNLVVGDFIEFQVYQSSGGALDLGDGGGNLQYAAAAKVLG